MADAAWCYPLTVQDGATRHLHGCQGTLAPTIEGSRLASSAGTIKEGIQCYPSADTSGAPIS